MPLRESVCFCVRLALILIAAIGCGSVGPATYQVTGTVTFDGEPVTDGQIIFFPVEEGLTPDAGPIKDGKFSFTAREGEKRVHIEAMREVPGEMIPRPAPMEGEDPKLEMFIPEIYNKKTTLDAVVTPVAAGNQFTFDLTSDGSAPE